MPTSSRLTNVEQVERLFVGNGDAVDVVGVMLRTLKLYDFLCRAVLFQAGRLLMWQFEKRYTHGRFKKIVSSNLEEMQGNKEL